MQDQSSNIVLILVHGTFATAAPWTQEGSRLREILTRRLPGARCESFLWSGRNSHDDRVTAGKALADRVRELHAANPDLQCFILAHSHGGNVVLYALKDPYVAERVMGVVAIATPFLHFRPRRVPRAVAPLVAFAYVEALSLGLNVVSTLLSPALRELWQGISEVFTPIAFVVLGQTGLPTTAYRRLRYAIAKRQNDVVQRAPWPVSNCSMLNLQVSLDEARLYLSFLGIVSQAALTILPALLLLALVFGGAGIVGDVGIVIAGAILMPLLVMALAVGMILRGSRFGFGRDAALDHLVVDVRISTVPFSNVTCFQQLDETGRIPFAPQRFGFEFMLPAEKRHCKLLPRVIPPVATEDVETLHLTGANRRSRWPGLRHSYLYDSDDIGKTISNWILAKLTMVDHSRLTSHAADSGGDS